MWLLRLFIDQITARASRTPSVIYATLPSALMCLVCHYFNITCIAGKKLLTQVIVSLDGLSSILIHEF